MDSRRFDALDRALAKLLNERAQVVVEVGKVKQQTGGPIYAPQREAAVLARVLGLSDGPLPDRSVEAVYKEIMSGSFAIEQPLRISGDDKTSVMFTTTHEPGALVQVLRAFADSGINLTHIDKRPSRRENWSYTFFLDAQGHRDEPAMAAAIDSARRHCQDLFVLGSYPRATRIL